MSRCVIHIGMRKTGTSSIQQSLVGFEDDQFVYANINGHPNHGAALYSIAADDPRALVFHKRRNEAAYPLAAYIEDVKAGLARSIAHAKGRTMIFSGEACSYMFTRAELARLREYLSRSFTRIDIVAYVRAPVGYMESNFQQRVKDAACRLNLEVDYFGYRDHLSIFDDLFGRDNVCLWKFEPKSFVGKCVVEDFCSRLQIGFPKERIVRVNESLSREAVALLFTYRKYGRALGSTAMDGPENQRLVEQLRNIGGSKFRLSADAVQPILDRHREDIEWMETRLGESLGEELAISESGGIRVEADLEDAGPKAVNELMRLLGARRPHGVSGETPEEVAALVHALRGTRPQQQRHVGKAGADQGRRPSGQGGGLEMTVTELLRQMRETQPAVFEGVSDAQAEALVAGLFEQINATLAGVDEGVVKFIGFGQFRVRKVQKEVDGKLVNRIQTVFRPAGGEGRGPVGPTKRRGPARA